MLSRWLAILMLVLLAVLPAAGEAVAAAGHCAPAEHAMVMDHSAVRPAAHGDCDHGAPHRQHPCTMMGLCTMSGCLALPGVTAPEAGAASKAVQFRQHENLRLDGLALAPPLEPPRA